MWPHTSYTVVWPSSPSSLFGTDSSLITFDMIVLLARVLLVDFSPPFDADTCEYLHDALVNFFSLVTHLSGPCRTPFFGLFVLKTGYPEVKRLNFDIRYFLKLNLAWFIENVYFPVESFCFKAITK